MHAISDLITLKKTRFTNNRVHIKKYLLQALFNHLRKALTENESVLPLLQNVKLQDETRSDQRVSLEIRRTECYHFCNNKIRKEKLALCKWIIYVIVPSSQVVMSNYYEMQKCFDFSRGVISVNF